MCLGLYLPYHFLLFFSSLMVYMCFRSCEAFRVMRRSGMWLWGLQSDPWKWSVTMGWGSDVGVMVVEEIVRESFQRNVGGSVGKRGGEKKWGKPIVAGREYVNKWEMGKNLEERDFGRGMWEKRNRPKFAFCYSLSFLFYFYFYSLQYKM